MREISQLCPLGASEGNARGKRDVVIYCGLVGSAGGEGEADLDDPRINTEGEKMTENNLRIIREKNQAIIQAALFWV